MIFGQTGNELDNISSGIDNAQRTSENIKQSAIRIEAINGQAQNSLQEAKQILEM